MNKQILMVKEVSDGLLIQFKGKGFCYFPTEFLVDSVGHVCNQVFLDYDQCAAEEAEDSGELVLQHKGAFAEPTYVS